MQNLRPSPERFFSDGMNNSIKPEYLKEGQSYVAMNCLLGDEIVDKGPGTTVQFDIGTFKRAKGGISTNSEMYAAYPNPGDTNVIIYRYTGSGTPVDIGVAALDINANVNFVDTGSAVYVLNGVDATGKIVIATYTQPAGIPIGKFGAWVNNRLYIAGNTTNPNRLYYSNLLAPDTFGGSDYIDVFPDDRSRITGLASFNGTLVITKRDNTLTFDGFTIDDFTIKRVKDQLANIGNMSHRSLVNTGDDLLFMSFSGFIPHIRSMKRTAFAAFNDGGIISEDIEGTMKTINKDALDQVCGGFDGRYAWWSVPTGSSTVNNLTICKDMTKSGSKGWTIHEDMNANVFFRSAVTGRDRFYLLSSDAESKLLYLDQTVGSRDGEALTLDFQSRAYRPDIARKSKFKYAYVTTDEDADTTLTVNASPDGFTYEEQDAYSLLTQSGGFPYTFPFSFGSSTQKRRRVNLHVQQANTLQLQFTETSTAKVKIKEYELFSYTRGLRDAR